MEKPKIKILKAIKIFAVAIAITFEILSFTSFSQTDKTSSNNEQQQTVYITDTGNKYHKGGCQYLKKSKIAISLENAKKQGYTACSRCF